MLRSIVENVLVDFVGDGEHIVFDTQVANQFQFFPAEHLAGGVVWRVKDYRLRVMLRGLVLKSFAQLLFVEHPLAPPLAAPLAFRCLRWTQTDEARLGSAQNRVWPIVLVERL